MKKLLFTISILLVSLTLSYAGETPVGSKSAGAMVIPNDFRVENEDEETSYLSPRKNDPNGPISLEVTCLRDLATAQLSPVQIEELLKRLNPGSELLHFGENIATTQAEDDKDEQGKEWHNVHYALYADKLLFTATLSTAKGREQEPQCKELLDEMNRIFTSLKRKRR